MLTKLVIASFLSMLMPTVEFSPDPHSSQEPVQLQVESGPLGNSLLDVNGRSFHSTTKRIQDARAIRWEGSSTWIALWKEWAQSQATNHYAIFRNETLAPFTGSTTYEISLLAGSFDPLLNPPPLSIDDHHQALWMVQFHTQPLDTYRQGIAALGGKVHSYLPHNTYVVELSLAARSAVAALPYVRWVGAYRSEYRLQRGLGDRSSASRNYRIQLIDNTPQTKQAAAADLRQLGAVVLHWEQGSSFLQAKLDGKQLLAVTHTNWLLFVDKLVPYLCQEESEICRESTRWIGQEGSFLSEGRLHATHKQLESQGGLLPVESFLLGTPGLTSGTSSALLDEVILKTGMLALQPVQAAGATTFQEAFSSNVLSVAAFDRDRIRLEGSPCPDLVFPTWNTIEREGKLQSPDLLATLQVESLAKEAQRLWREGSLGKRLGASDRTALSASALKALLIHSARLEEGLRSVVQDRQGWGVPDLANLLGEERQLSIQDHRKLSSLQSHSYSLRVLPETEELRLTLVYAGQIPNAASKSWEVNEFDLRAVSPTGQAFELGPEPIYTDATGSFCGKKKAAQLFQIQSPVPGTWTIQVTASNVPVSNNTSTQLTSYALVSTGGPVLNGQAGCTPIPNGLVAWWPMYFSGNIGRDWTGNYDMSCPNPQSDPPTICPLAGAVAPPGCGVLGSFNGVSTALERPLSAPFAILPNAPRTFEGRISMSALQGDGGRSFFGYSAPESKFGIGAYPVGGGNFQLRVFYEGCAGLCPPSHDSVGTFNGALTHIAVTVTPVGSSQIGIRCYINGSIDPIGVHTIPVSNFNPSTGRLYLGCAFQDFFDGSLWDMAVYDRVLSASEIALLASGDDCSKCAADCNNNGIPDNNEPDTDNDGTPNDCDLCSGFDDNVDTDNDSVPNGCDICLGSDDSLDADMDGVPDGCDICPGSDDSLDADNDGVPDGCDDCPGSDDSLDTDNDGVPNGCDLCPGFDDNADDDGDGVPNGCDICLGSDDSLDADMDGVPDGCDICPGSDDSLDGDSDGAPDGCDDCPGSDDSLDTDNDGVPNGCDLCPGFDDNADDDGDGVPNGCDICPGSSDSLDTDNDGIPNGCDACPGFDDSLDADNDGVPDGCDACSGFDDAVDSDFDGTPDGCDGCPNNPDKTQPGDCGCDVAEDDSDGDGIPDCNDVCPGSFDGADRDSDLVPDGCDNCPSISNPTQEDCDNDGIGDLCEIASGALDCNNNEIPDSCEDGTWAGVSAPFLSPAAWTDGSIPFSTAFLSQVGPDALCTLDDNHSLCTLELLGSAPGNRMSFEIHDVALEVENALLGKCSEIYGSGSLTSSEFGELEISSGGRLRVLSNQTLSASHNVTNAGIIDLSMNSSLNLGSGLTSTGAIQLGSGSTLMASNIFNHAVDGSDSPDLDGCWGSEPRAEIVLNGAEIFIGFNGQLVNSPPAPCNSILGGTTLLCTRVLCRSTSEITGDISNGVGGIVTIDTGSTTTVNGAIHNEGLVHVTNASTLIVTSIVDQNMGLVVAGDCFGFGCPPSTPNPGPKLAAALIVDEDLTLSAGGGIIANQANISLGGSFDVAVTDSSRFQMAQASLNLTGFSQTQSVEALAQDAGTFINSTDPDQFVIGSMFIGPGSVAQIVDQHQNSGGDEVLYVTNLELAPFSALDLAGNAVYYENLVLPGSAIITDSVGGGSVVEATPQFETFCYGDGTELDCPCSNTGAPGHGCDNSSGTGGARLEGAGLASVSQDSVLLTATSLPLGVSSLLFQGTQAFGPVPFGDGTLCVTGQIKRLWVHPAAGGTTQFPQGSEDPLSVFGGIAPAGQTTYYQVWYRDQAEFCSTQKFNTSNAVQVEWTP